MNISLRREMEVISPSFPSFPRQCVNCNCCAFLLGISRSVVMTMAAALFARTACTLRAELLAMKTVKDAYWDVLL